MTMQDIVSAHAAIAAQAGDPEMAHSAEDALHIAFLKAVAAEAPEPWCTHAALILTTRQIAFPRWCA